MRVSSPVRGQDTYLRAKGKLMAAAAEKFRGLSRGLLPAVGTESGDRGLERVGEGVPTTKLLRLPLRQLQGCRPSDGLHGLHGLPGLNRHGLWLLGDRLQDRGER